MIKQYIFFLLWLSTCFANASHIIGGKFTYKNLGSNKYEIKLTVYRDCSDFVDLDQAAVISIYTIGNNPSLFYNKDIPLNSRSTLPTPTLNPCFVPPYPVCVEQGNYIDTITFPPNNYGYTLIYQKCCRNINVQNVLLPSMTGISITTDIPASINNSSDFTYYPPIYVCQNDTFAYSFAATDADGDSLAYQLCDALSGGSNINPSPNPNDPPPYSVALWTNGYSTSNQIANSGGIILNSATGLLKFKPLLIGQFAIAVSVKEYRNGILIHITRLEFEFNVVACRLTSSILTTTNICEGLTVNFKNKSANANAYHWDFGDNLAISDTSNLATPSYTFPAYGTYSITLIAMNTAYSFCKDTSIAVVNINPLLSPTLQPKYSSCFQNNEFLFSVGGTFVPSATFNWNFTAYSNLQFQTGNQVYASFTDVATKTISVIASQFGCADTLLAVVSFSNPIALINAGLLNCVGKSIYFNNISTQSTDFKWDFGVLSLTSDTSSLEYPTYIYPAFGIYTVTLIALGGNCSDTLTEKVIVAPTLSLNPSYSLTPQCFENNSFNFAANGIYSKSATFSWFFGSEANIPGSNLENPCKIHFTTQGNHLVKFVVSDYGCERTRTELVKILPSPTISATTSPTVGCEPLSVNFISQNSKLTWNFGNISSSLPNSNYVFQQAGSYNYSLSVVGSNSCVATKIGAVVVYPKPSAKSVVKYISSDLVDNKIILIDSTLDGVYSLFDFGDGLQSVKRESHHSYEIAGIYHYFLVSTNGFGCSDTTGGTVTIDASNSIYIPNTFTPNEDQLNDLFIFKGENIAQAEMTICDRWGEKIFYSNDLFSGWNGKDQKSGKVCKSDVYIYQIKVTFDAFGKARKEKTFTGYVYLYVEP